MKKIDVAIILLNYNNSKDTIECIDSIKNNEKKINYRIILVDNNSNKNDVNILKNIKNIDLILRNINDGFANGNNEGIKYAIDKYDPDFILLLNNDTIVTENSIYELISNSDSKSGIITCKLMNYYKKNEVDCFGGRINWLKVIGDFNYIYLENDEKYCYLSSGACMLISKKVINSIGLLSSDYFMYYEDLDYSYRVIKNGFRIKAVDSSIIYHKGGASAGKASPFAIKWNNRNRIIFAKKYLKFRLFFYIYYFFTRIIYIFKYILTGKKAELSALIDGIILGIRWR